MREEEERTALCSMADAHTAVHPRAARSDGGRLAVAAARSDGPWARPPAQTGPAGRPPDRAASGRSSPSARSDRRRLERTAGMLSDSSDGTDGLDGATSDRAVIMRPRHRRKNLTV